MLNYMKSEFYRILRGQEIYWITVMGAGLPVLFNMILYLSLTGDPNFPYANVFFSLGTLTSCLTILFIAAFIVVSVLFGNQKQHGTLKNTVAYGISRDQIFIGKCLVCIVLSLCMLAVVLFFYIGSAYLLIQNSGPEPVIVMLQGVGAALPSALATELLAIVLYSLCNRPSVAVACWMVIVFVIPEVFMNLGRFFEFFRVIADWMPAVFLQNEVFVTRSTAEGLWNTSYGLMKCIVAGFGGVAVFGTVGLLGFRKKEL